MLKDRLQLGLDFLKDKIIEEITQQGHVASGKLIASVESVIQDKGSVLVGKILLNDYSYYLDKGVKAEKIPYTRGSGKKSSKYIDDLIAWGAIVKPSLSAKELKSFAFAVANKHKKEGNPTSGSYAFSKNGRRKAWSEFAIDNNLTAFVEILNLELALVAELENTISKFIISE